MVEIGTYEAKARSPNCSTRSRPVRPSSSLATVGGGSPRCRARDPRRACPCDDRADARGPGRPAQAHHRRDPGDARRRAPLLMPSCSTPRWRRPGSSPTRTTLRRTRRPLDSPTRRRWSPPCSGSRSVTCCSSAKGADGSFRLIPRDSWPTSTACRSSGPGALQQRSASDLPVLTLYLPTMPAISSWHVASDAARYTGSSARRRADKEGLDLVQ